MPAKAHAEPNVSTNSSDAIFNKVGMKVTDLLAGVTTAQPSSVTSEVAEREVSGIAYNSRKVTAGSAFFAIRGETTDGNLFISDAIDRGASVVVSELPRLNAAALSSEWQQLFSRVGPLIAPPTIPDDVAWIQVPEPRKALSIAAANYFHHPAAALKLIGITGTSGKTTTSFLVDSILRA